MFFGKITFKIAVLIAVLLVFTASLFSVLTLETMNQHIADEVIRKAESLARSTASISAYSILSGDSLGMDNVVSKIKKTNPDVKYIAVADKNMNVLAHDRLEKRGGRFVPARGTLIKEYEDGTYIREAGGDLYELTTPVVFNSIIIGSVAIGFTKAPLVSAQRESRRKIIAGLSLTLIVGIICTIFLSSFITRPIKELSGGVHQFTNGELAAPLKVYSGDELGSLTRSFNQMTELIINQQEKLGSYARQLEESYVSTVKVLAAAIDARDPYTLGHSERVSKFSLKIGEAIGLSRKELEDLEVAALFHDVGKLRTPDYVLLRDGSLDSRDYDEIKKHPGAGAEILERAPSLRKYVPAVKYHHEWYNGNGYPDGLRGTEIPLYASIISIADAFDAMTSIRPYKKPFSKEAAMTELALLSGKQFNPELVKTFMQIIRSHPAPPKELAGNELYEHR